MGIGGSPLNTGMINVPVRSTMSESNVSALFGTTGAIDRFLQEHREELKDALLKTVAQLDGEEIPKKRRGRKQGSTNWSKERFWRRYRIAARGLKRPYVRTHLAVGMKLTYATFAKYLALWGPPQDVAGPGD
jgi:hypothetical protein